MIRTVVLLVTLVTPAAALEEPVPWRDPDTGCAYWLTPQGGIAPRFRSDGQPDCPGTQEPARPRKAPVISERALREITRELTRGLDALKREVDQLSEWLGRR